MKHLLFLLNCCLVVAAMAVGAGPALAQQPAAQTVQLNVAQLRQQLAPAATRRQPDGSVTYRLVLPTLRGPKPFVLLETFVLPASDAAARQRLRTFVGQQQDDPTSRVALVLTPRELTAQLLRGTQAVSLRPAPRSSTTYVLRPEAAVQGPCGTLAPAGELLRPESFDTTPTPFSFGTELRRLRYAILVTREYYEANGNTDAAVELAVATAMNQMSGLYLQELAVRYELVRPTGGAFYFSAMDAPTLPGSDPATPGRLREQNLEDVGDFINARFSPSSFDLGHCFQNGGGGVAYVGIICNSTYKAQAWSGVGARSGFQGILAHEMGHQHGAAHTFTGQCGGYSLGSNLEPGGGATIMAYTDVCGAQTLQDVVGTEADHFNTRSLDQMRRQLLSVTCPATTANANRPPVLSAGPNHVIPRNTPFTLTASGSDPDGETLYYTWNQFDYTENVGALGTIAGIKGLAAIDDPEAPLFRPRPPRLAPSRTFPDLRYVLANGNQPPNLSGEALPNVARDLHFVVTARDQRATGGTFTTANVTLTVAPNTGPFALTTQNEPALWISGQPATVTWSVNGTDQAPISVAQVRISLSTDGGQTFSRVLAAAAPNTGSAAITVPSVTTSRARIRVEAVGNVFFDINDSDFPIGPCTPVASQTLPATPLTAAAGDDALNLPQLGFSLTALAGTSQLSGTISATDPSSTLTDLNGGNCLRYSNVTYYDTHVFVPSTSASYSISTPTGFSNMVLRVYEGTGFDPANPCQNLLADNFIPNVFLPRDVTLPLLAGRSYTLVVSNFGGTPDAGSTYSVAFTSTPAGGTAYTPLQSQGFDYQFAAINTTTNVVARIAPTADLRALPAGVYDVYGFLFQRSYSVANLQNRPLSALLAALAGVAPCGQLSGNARRVTITGTTPLPVVLTDFSGRAASGSTLLQWQTASEDQVAHFEVQRSPDGKQFASIGQVAATNSQRGQDYTFTDPTPPAGLSYYRLLTRDLDGTAAYSQVAAVQHAAEATGLRATAFPNPVPAGTILRLEVQSPTAQSAEVQLTDLAGRVLLRRQLALAAGTTPLSLPGARQWHGLHLLHLQTAGGQRWQQKLVLE